MPIFLVATQVLPSTPPSPGPRPAGHSWHIVVAVAVLLLFMLMIVAISWLQWRTPRTEDQVMYQVEAPILVCSAFSD